MNDTFKSRMYNIQFIHREKSYTLNVSEVTLAHGAISYAVKLLNYKGLFIETNNRWKVISNNITSQNLQKHIIKQLRLHCQILRLMDRSIINTSSLI